MAAPDLRTVSQTVGRGKQPPRRRSWPWRLSTAPCSLRRPSTGRGLRRTSNIQSDFGVPRQGSDSSQHTMRHHEVAPAIAARFFQRTGIRFAQHSERFGRCIVAVFSPEWQGSHRSPEGGSPGDMCGVPVLSRERPTSFK